MRAPGLILGALLCAGCLSAVAGQALFVREESLAQLRDTRSTSSQTGNFNNNNNNNNFNNGRPGRTGGSSVRRSPQRRAPQAVEDAGLQQQQQQQQQPQQPQHDRSNQLPWDQSPHRRRPVQAVHQDRAEEQDFLRTSASQYPRQQYQQQFTSSAATAPAAQKTPQFQKQAPVFGKPNSFKSQDYEDGADSNGQYNNYNARNQFSSNNQFSGNSNNQFAGSNNNQFGNQYNNNNPFGAGNNNQFGNQYNNNANNDNRNSNQFGSRGAGQGGSQQAGGDRVTYQFTSEGNRNQVRQSRQFQNGSQQKPHKQEQQNNSFNNNNNFNNYNNNNFQQRQPARNRTPQQVNTDFTSFGATGSNNFNNFNNKLRNSDDNDIHRVNPASSFPTGGGSHQRIQGSNFQQFQRVTSTARPAVEPQRQFQAARTPVQSQAPQRLPQSDIPKDREPQAANNRAARVPSQPQSTVSIDQTVQSILNWIQGMSRTQERRARQQGQGQPGQPSREYLPAKEGDARPRPFQPSRPADPTRQQVTPPSRQYLPVPESGPSTEAPRPFETPSPEAPSGPAETPAPGPAPGPEPGPAPGPEPGPAPGPEPGPEPVPFPIPETPAPELETPAPPAPTEPAPGPAPTDAPAAPATEAPQTPAPTEAATPPAPQETFAPETPAPEVITDAPATPAPEAVTDAPTPAPEAFTEPAAETPAETPAPTEGPGPTSAPDAPAPEQPAPEAPEQPAPEAPVTTSPDDNGVHPPHIHAIDVQCAKDMMTITIEFDKPYDGIIYSKGFFKDPNCRYVQPNSNQIKYTFTVMLNSCGTQFVDDFQGAGQAYLENVIVLQNEEGIQEVWDSIRSVRCLWEGNLKQALTVALSVGSLNQEIVTFGGDTGMAKLDIQLGRGPFAPAANGLVKIGEVMTLVVSVEGDPGFDVQVRACVARDADSSNLVQLTDDSGCVLKPKLLGAFQKTKDTGNTGASIIAYAFFQAFKFPDVMDLIIECTVDLCKTDCEMCPNPNQKIEPGARRRRRAAWSGNATHGAGADAALIGDGLDDDLGVVMGRRLRVFTPDELPADALLLEALGQDLNATALPLLGDSVIHTESRLASRADGVCMSVPGFAASSAVVLSLLTASCLLSAALWLKLQRSHLSKHLVNQ